MLERIPFGKPEIVIAVAGPAFSAAMGCVICAPFLCGLISTNHMVTQMIYTIGYINCILAVFNVLPIFPMDGGRIFRGILFLCTHKIVQATRVVVFGGLVVVLPVVFVTGLLPLTLWTGFIVFVIASLGLQELKQVEMLYKDGVGDPNALNTKVIEGYMLALQLTDSTTSSDVQDFRKKYPGAEHRWIFDQLDTEWLAMSHEERMKTVMETHLQLMQSDPANFVAWAKANDELFRGDEDE